MSRPSIPENVRLAVQVKWLSACAYCGELVIKGHIDHLVPYSKGGAHDFSNFVWSCPQCNQEKSNNTINWTPSKPKPMANLVANVILMQPKLEKVLDLLKRL